MVIMCVAGFCGKRDARQCVPDTDGLVCFPTCSTLMRRMAWKRVHSPIGGAPHQLGAKLRRRKLFGTRCFRVRDAHVLVDDEVG